MRERDGGCQNWRDDAREAAAEARGEVLLRRGRDARLRLLVELVVKRLWLQVVVLEVAHRRPDPTPPVAGCSRGLAPRSAQAPSSLPRSAGRARRFRSRRLTLRTRCLRRHGTPLSQHPARRGSRRRPGTGNRRAGDPGRSAGALPQSRLERRGLRAPSQTWRPARSLSARLPCSAQESSATTRRGRPRPAARDGRHVRRRLPAAAPVGRPRRHGARAARVGGGVPRHEACERRGLIVAEDEADQVRGSIPFRARADERKVGSGVRTCRRGDGRKACG